MMMPAVVSVRRAWRTSSSGCREHTPDEGDCGGEYCEFLVRGHFPFLCMVLTQSKEIIAASSDKHFRNIAVEPQIGHLVKYTAMKLKIMTRREFTSGMTATACAAAVTPAFATSNAKGRMNMKKVDIKALAKEDAFKLIGSDWMLVCAGQKDKFNMMTASWGGIGWLWNKPVVFVFIRPERYTHEFIEREGRFTLSFFKDEWKDALRFCGSKSGRDYDKCKETGIKGVALETGVVTFEQARLALDCRKLFKSTMAAANFIDKSILERWYNTNPGGSLHDVYVGEIEGIYEA